MRIQFQGLTSKASPKNRFDKFSLPKRSKTVNLTFKSLLRNKEENN